METKSNIRARVLQRRDNLPLSERDRKSQEICSQLEARLIQLSPTRAAHETRPLSDETSPAATPLIAVYAAMKSEVSLDAFIIAAYARGTRVCFPCMMRISTDKINSFVLHMEFREVTRRDYESGKAPFIVHPLRSYAPNAAEVRDFPLVAACAISLIVVPLVAFDQRGGRLGYGGGNYDRFLPLIAPTAPLTGVAFAEQEVSLLPREGHDVELTEIIRA
ncbi:MAG: 5-formyltetrahydrofolate cyclo-ligase [Raoultibacter sp.]